LVPYSKSYLTLDQQIAKLKANGLIIHNESYAKKCLIGYNYYRLSAYWHLFRQRDPNDITKKLGIFEQGHTFEEVIQIYEFDYQLRRLIFEAITDIETFLRTQIAYHIPSINNDAFAMYDQTLFYRRPRRNIKGLNYNQLMIDINSEISRAKDEDFISHFKNTYSDYPKIPFWVLTEIISFGTLRKIYKHLKSSHKHLISNSFNIGTISSSSPSPYIDIDKQNLDSHLFLINKYRNVCAHHGRIWNRKVRDVLTTDAATELQISGHTNGGLYALIIVIARLLGPTGHAKDWKDSIYSLLTKSFPLGDITKFTTLPSDWHNHPVWK
jgi:abortive infection bacteriophage resistance protein